MEGMTILGNQAVVVSYLHISQGSSPYHEGTENVEAEIC